MVDKILNSLLDERIPLVILSAGGAFIFASISNEGFFLKQSLFIFASGILSALARQVYRDVIFFLRNKKLEEGTSDPQDQLTQHWIYWKIYYCFQLLLLGVAAWILTKVLGIPSS